ncbi:MAG: inositol monophosphatase family protein [Elusimicrobiaceae bacterium]|nr:inositol monophosphatase family protein [Elusimicrobiaceae bacterium]
MKEQTVLTSALKTCGGILLHYFRRTDYKLKGKGDLLTQADLESQRAALEIITSAFPEHDYLAEEKSERITGSRHLWVMDPLDGTTNYAHGLPTACVSIALLKDGEPVLGGVLDPFRDELFLARKGHGSTLNGGKIRVTKTAKLKDSLLFTGFPYDRYKRGNFYCGFIEDFLKICHDIRRTGSAALDMSWIAAGRSDGYWEFVLKPWDVAAGRLLVQEAGGKVTDFSGKPWTAIERYGAETLATNGLIHTEMLRIIKHRLKTGME